MSKEYEKIRQKIAKEYKEQLSSLSIQNKTLEKENELLKEKLVEMEVQLIEKNEWIERMQEYCNMTPEDLKTILSNEKRREELGKTFSMLSGFLKQYG